MTTQRTPQSITTQLNEESITNGWEELRPLLDPVVIAASRDCGDWQHLDAETVFWLSHTAAQSPWLNHLALAGVIYAAGGAAHPVQPIKQTLCFLRWAIPDHYPDLAALKVEEALAAYYGDPPHDRGTNAARAYGALQLYMQRYLESMSAEKRAELGPFLLPRFARSGRLAKLQVQAQNHSQAERKDQAFAVVRELPALVTLGRQRYKWLADLDLQVQQTVTAVTTSQLTLPALIKIKDLDNRCEVVFRVWDRRSWIIAHSTTYSTDLVRLAQQQPNKVAGADVFLQLVGSLPETPWFLRAIEAGLFQGVKPSPDARRYMLKWQVLFPGQAQAGLLRPSPSLGQTLGDARRSAAHTPEDSAILFCVEPLLAGATVGLFVLVSLVQTGMRIGELMQVTLDRECLETTRLPEFDDQTGTWREGSQQIYWRLYPKGHEKRERYLVTAQMLEAMLVMLDLHKRLYGEKSLQAVPACQGSQFSHARRYPGKHKFVLQWGGHHLPIQTLQKCLSFLLLEHPCRNLAGQPTRITPHLLRHGVAGWLRVQGIPLEEIMALLKQVNLAVTDYYSKLSPQDLYQKIGPALTALANLSESDPAALRTVEDIQTLVENALKRYGVLRHTPGGTCAVFTPCEVQFKCASCPHYIPDPDRRQEVQEKIANHVKAVALFGELGDYLQAEAHQAQRHAWERIEKEMFALAQVNLASPPLDSVLTELGGDDFGEELLLNLAAWPQLPSGDD